MAYLTLQAVLGLETLWQWPLEMYKAVPKVSRQSAPGKGVITPSPPPALAKSTSGGRNLTPPRDPARWTRLGETIRMV